MTSMGQLALEVTDTLITLDIFDRTNASRFLLANKSYKCKSYTIFSISMFFFLISLVLACFDYWELVIYSPSNGYYNTIYDINQSNYK